MENIGCDLVNIVSTNIEDAAWFYIIGNVKDNAEGAALFDKLCETKEEIQDNIMDSISWNIEVSLKPDR